jgi:transcriptional regulator with GAF, ATPase, and Fis domain
MDADSGGQLESLAASLARARGEDFFRVLAEALARVLGAREAHVCEVGGGRRVRALAVWRADGIAANYEYDIDAARMADGTFFEMPLAAKDGAVLGHLFAWIDGNQTFDATQRAACAVLADRAGAELRLTHVKRERALLRAQLRQLRGEVHAVHDIDAIVGVSAGHARILDEMRRVAAADASVLVRGEPGTGKELVARAIHAWSQRAAKPFTRIDCASPGIDAELRALPQIIALTSGGTLFFDEVGALPLELQSRLVAALPSAGGERRDLPVAEVRVMASTNRDLRKLMHDGEFREDLFYRLNVFPIDIPPLRARIEDIAPLVQHFVRRLSLRLGRRIDSIDPNSLAELARHSWPGNVRELATLVERSMVTHSGPVLKVSADLFATASPAERAALIAAAAVDTATTGRHALAADDFDETLNTGLHAVQREHILRVLHATHWVIEGNSGAALKLGMKPATLRHRMKKLGISRAQNPQAH